MEARQMGTHRWTEASIPDLSGMTAVVTGANTGLGFETARMLAAHGAAVVLACRDMGKAEDASRQIAAVVPGAAASTLHLDLSSLASVRSAAGTLRSRHGRIDLLINNAGGIIRQYGKTEDGFERTLATNHLGPFAFTGLVMDLLRAAPGARIVTVSSVGHRRGVIRFEDLQSERGYRFQHAYFQSKLANLMFTYELQRRLEVAGAAVIAVAAHPGNAHTQFGRDLPAVARMVLSPRARPVTFWLLQSAPIGALSIVRAAVDSEAAGGDYYGPPGRAQFTGYPERVRSSARSHDTDAQRRLWEVSEQLTRVGYAPDSARDDSCGSRDVSA
jgi:NAD(P)-dependent dehydrogenase (short-subunit alcohol dehydrogenase family)